MASIKLYEFKFSTLRKITLFMKYPKAAPNIKMNETMQDPSCFLFTEGIIHLNAQIFTSAYQGVKNVSFSENFACTLNE